MPRLPADDPPDQGSTSLRAASRWSTLVPSIRKTIARLTWSDARGAREATLTRATTVGSSRESPLQLVDPTVSRIHAEIEPREDGIHITDLGSRNGLFLRNTRIWKASLTEPTQVIFGDLPVEIRPAIARDETTLWPAAWRDARVTPGTPRCMSRQKQPLVRIRVRASGTRLR